MTTQATTNRHAFGFDSINNRVTYLTTLLDKVDGLTECVPAVLLVEKEILDYGDPLQRFEETKDEVTMMFATLSIHEKRTAVYAKMLSEKALDTSHLAERSRDVLKNIATFLGVSEHELQNEVEQNSTPKNPFYYLIKVDRAGRESLRLSFNMAKNPSIIEGAKTDERLRESLERIEESMSKPIGKEIIRNVALYTFVEVERTKAFLSELINLYGCQTEEHQPAPADPQPTEPGNGVKLQWKADKADLAEVVYALYKSGRITDTSTGKDVTKKLLAKELGELFGVDLSDMETPMTGRKNSNKAHYDGKTFTRHLAHLVDDFIKPA